MKISINIIATGNYVKFIEPLVKSSEEFFFKTEEKTYIIYSDREIVTSNHIIWKRIDHEKWPFPTLKRFHYFNLSKKEILGSDFSFYIDADSLFVNEFDIDLNERVETIATIHPGFKGGIGTPERNPNSSAYIRYGERNVYFCGGFFGGNSRSFINMSEEISSNIDDDLSKGIIAVWHDESHLNKYFLKNKPSVILDHTISVSESSFYEGEREEKIIFLDKSHAEIRNFESQGNKEVLSIKI
jgi:hypothetical protein